jgi:hypothetical protein
LYSVGHTFGVPDSVMGLTLLAAGGSLPEAFSSIILARKGESCTRICPNKKFLGIICMYCYLIIFAITLNSGLLYAYTIEY